MIGINWIWLRSSLIYNYFLTLVLHSYTGENSES